MLKITSLATCLGLASASHAGDYLEGHYLYIIDTIPANIPNTETPDVTLPEFRGTLALLSKEWTDLCDAPVSAWHSSLMRPVDSTINWPENQWVLILAAGETEAEVNSNLPESSCVDRGRVKQMNILYPGQFYICLSREDDPGLFDQVCY